MAATEQTQLREAIARLEQRIEELADAVERSRKAILASKLCIIAGALLMLALVMGILGGEPLALVVAIASLLGGIVGFGSNVSTMRQDTSAMQSAAASRADLIARLDLHDIGQRTDLSLH